MLYTYFEPKSALIKGQAVEAWEPSKEAKNFQKWGRIRKKYFPHTHGKSVYGQLAYTTELVQLMVTS